MSDWADLVDEITASVFRISTPGGHGTGFLLHVSPALCAIATAHHVISHADEWEEPIRLTHHATKKSQVLRPDDRVISTLPSKDLAFIIFKGKKFDLEPQPFQLIESSKRIRQGVELGWCGFPAVAANDLCFFSGYVSSYLHDEESYLIDGVAINGVSGGPAFSESRTLCGIVTAYIPNRATGESLPGVCLIRDVAPYHTKLEELKSMEQAQAESEASANDDSLANAK